MSRYKQESFLILEQLSAAIDAEDNIPKEIFDKNHELKRSADMLWKTQSLINVALNSDSFNFIPSNNLDLIMNKINDIEIQNIPVNIINSKQSKLKGIIRHIGIKNIKQNAKKWLNILFPIGITAAFMGLSVSTHNMELFNNSQNLYINSTALTPSEDDKRINMYISAHQRNDSHAYGLVNIANTEDIEDNYVDNYTFKTSH